MLVFLVHLFRFVSTTNPNRQGLRRLRSVCGHGPPGCGFFGAAAGARLGRNGAETFGPG